MLDICVDPDGCRLDLSRVDYRLMCAKGRSHILLALPAGTIQLDLQDDIGDRTAVGIRPVIDLVRPVEPQVCTTRRLAALLSGTPETISREPALARLVAAVRVHDALAEGASQRDIGLGIFGDDWPGDGEHLKSRVRRMIPFAAAMMRAGPRALLRHG